MSSTPVYLDHAATTRPFADVAELVRATALEHFGNPSSTHGFGARPRRLLEDARDFLRGSLGAARLVFTSGGTEADFLGVVGAALARRPGRVLAAASDHKAVLGLEQALAWHRFELEKVPVTAHGDLDPETLFDHLGKDVRAVSLLHGHNELGTLCDLGELVDVIRRASPEAHIHVDLVQSYGKIDFDLDLAGVDSVAVAGHKLHGPRGIGFLAMSSTARIIPVLTGGGQEDGMRGGTENVPAAVGLALAAERMLTHLDANAEAMRDCCDELFEQLVEEFPDARRLGHPERRLPHVLSVRIPDVPGEALQMACAAAGVAFSTGSACLAGGQGHNHVLQAIGLAPKEQREVFRVSVAAETTFDEIDRAARVICTEAERLRAVAARGEPPVGRRRAGRDRVDEAAR